ncbi:transposase [Saccharomonospora sp. CUA-673]|uniref:transposase n=1 Tax=Saccharomonospora sp. CUA-673 TaxID=1904969 RepID=UPI0009607645|nr:transposase [Saccharomonospora sp. CUA-673]OLT41641.1 transposase [Saccharomonospora sp. CUA-673]
MSESRRKFDPEFREGAVRLVLDTGRPVAEVARELGVNAGTLGNWVAKDREQRGVTPADPAAEVQRLQAELAAVRMERDLLKRSVVLWVKEATK